MVISHKYNLCFCHIPKNGGTFVSNFLKFLDPDCLDVRNDKGLGHQDISEIIEFENYSEIKDYVFFSVIRNPAQKIISSYNFYYHAHYDDFNLFLMDLSSVESRSKHLFNLDYVLSAKNTNHNLRLLNFDRLSEDIISFFMSLDFDKKDFLKKVESFDFAPVNYSNKIVTELTQENIDFVKTYELVKREFDFWDYFDTHKINYLSEIIGF